MSVLIELFCSVNIVFLIILAYNIFQQSPARGGRTLPAGNWPSIRFPIICSEVDAL